MKKAIKAAVLVFASVGAVCVASAAFLIIRDQTTPISHTLEPEQVWWYGAKGTATACASIEGSPQGYINSHGITLKLTDDDGGSGGEILTYGEGKDARVFATSKGFCEAALDHAPDQSVAMAAPVAPGYDSHGNAAPSQEAANQKANDAAVAAPREWYAVSAENPGKCFKTEGPSRIIKEYDLTDGDVHESEGGTKVEVDVSNSDHLSSTIYTYWSSMEGCMSEGANRVDSLAKKYE